LVNRRERVPKPKLLCCRFTTDTRVRAHGDACATLSGKAFGLTVLLHFRPASAQAPSGFSPTLTIAKTAAQDASAFDPQSSVAFDRSSREVCDCRRHTHSIFCLGQRASTLGGNTHHDRGTL
jgi:hypothetical protein